MTIDEIIDYVRTLDSSLAVTAAAGDGSPEIAWGDTFIYYAPEGEMPAHTQPYATVVTKDYPDDRDSDLDQRGAFRLNIAVSKSGFRDLFGREPRQVGDDDYAALDTVFPHPVYGQLGWVGIVNPGPKTERVARDLLASAHQAAAGRSERRAGTPGIG